MQLTSAQREEKIHQLNHELESVQGIIPQSEYINKLEVFFNTIKEHLIASKYELERDLIEMKSKRTEAIHYGLDDDALVRVNKTVWLASYGVMNIEQQLSEMEAKIERLNKLKGN